MPEAGRAVTRQNQVLFTGMSMSQNRDIYDPAFVKGVFDRCSARYIGFSYFCSLGFTERWRRQCIEALPEPKPTGTAYDLMAGTGEAWRHLINRLPHTQSIIAVDISSGMHQRAMKRLHAHRAHRISFIEDDVLNSKIPDASADLIISTFGLKTFNNDQHQRLARLVARALKPGGAFSFIEASDPKGWLFRGLYNFHLRAVLPFVERTLLRGAHDFAMIGRYCANFSDASEFARMLSESGLETRYRKYFFGCATGVSGRKPA
jgi:demethylmenaquinone methyltransferase/2-methoxy-6-polyprenyl-1,4-benzoquinol methylase